MSKKDKVYAKRFFDALSDPDQNQMFSLQSGEVGDVEGFFITATGKNGVEKPVALVLTDDVRELIKEALDQLFEPVDGDENEDDESDEDEPRASRARRESFLP